MKRHFQTYLTAAMLLLLPFTVKGQGKSPIMFWNVENYFDIYDDPDTADDEFTPMGDKHWGRTKFEDKRNIIAKTILSVKEKYGEYPSLIGFAEIENYYVLKELTQDTPLAKEGYGIVHRSSRDPRGIETALIYKEGLFTPLKVKAIKIEQADTSKHLRHILYVKGLYLFPDNNRDTLHLFINHWPSKLGNKKSAELNRIASAQALSHAVDSIYIAAYGNSPLPKIILMGDFNDSPESLPVELLTSSAAPMVNLALPLKKGSHHYQGRWSKIDQFIVSPPLRERKMVIYDWKSLYYRKGHTTKPIPGRTYSGPRYLGGASDHYPILLILE